MKLSRVTNYKQLKERKAKLQEEVALKESLLRADVASIKSSFSFLNILKNAGGFLLSNGSGQQNVMNAGFKLGMQAIPFLFRRKGRASGIKGMLVERALLAVAPKALNIAANALLGVLAKTAPDSAKGVVISAPDGKSSPAIESTVVKTTYPAKK